MNKFIERRVRIIFGVLAFVFVAAVLILFFYIFVFNKYGYDVYYAKFTSSKNVYPSMPITINDIAVGRVVKTVLDKDNLITATIDIKKEYSNRMREDSVLVANINYISGRVDVLKLYPGTNKIVPGGSFIESSDSKIGKMLRDNYIRRENIPVNIAQMFLESRIFYEKIFEENKLNEEIKIIYDKLKTLDEDLKNGKLKFITSKEERIFLEKTLNDIRNTLNSLDTQIEAVTLIAKMIPLDYNTGVFDDMIRFLGVSNSSIESIAKALPYLYDIIVNLEKAVGDIKDFLINIEYMYEY